MKKKNRLRQAEWKQDSPGNLLPQWKSVHFVLLFNNENTTLSNSAPPESQWVMKTNFLFKWFLHSCPKFALSPTTTIVTLVGFSDPLTTSGNVEITGLLNCYFSREYLLPSIRSLHHSVTRERQPVRFKTRTNQTLLTDTNLRVLPLED